jgi:3-isopropylmalate dehydratase, small subunit
MNSLKGRVAWIFDDHYDVDLIIGVHYIHEKNIEKLVPINMKNYDVDFNQSIKPGDFLVAGQNLGYGHPHPQAMKVMRELGINVVVAKSFARVFFKNEVAAGMKLFPCPTLPDDIERWEELEVDLEEMVVIRHKDNSKYPLAAVPPIELEIIKDGGIVPYLRKNLAE